MFKHPTDSSKSSSNGARFGITDRLRAVTQWLFGIALVALLVPACGEPLPEGSLDVAEEKSAITVSPQPVVSPPPTSAPPGAPPVATPGQPTVWVMMKQHASLGAAAATKNWKTKGTLVHDSLKAMAKTSQASLQGFLAARKISFKSFWIVNAVKITAPQSTIDEIARRSDVARIVPDGSYQIPPIQPGAAGARIQVTEWGLDNIRAPEAWDAFGTRGDGIVVASIDTGVQFDHPALVNQYRGNQGGSFDHNYNWFDPAGICGDPSAGPCDNAAHGTHTMGTMVGDDGAGNQIGVAPQARWLAAKGCEDFFCSFESLVSSGEWILAPTDLNGENPRPDLRPNIVNNSWGSGPGDIFFQEIVRAWVAAGIFPAFSQGNSGDFCGTASSPGDYPESYGAGAYDINNLIAPFSSRGPSVFSEIKPNISAPGVNVRSSVPRDSFDFFSGTSMASPHVAGSVALMWSAAPALIGDIGATRSILDETAIDTSDLTCGGDDSNNNVYGQGRLDAFAAVDLSPRGPTGTLEGIVTNTFGEPLVGVNVRAAGDATTRSARTNDAGAYRIVLPIGTYSVTASLFAYVTQTADGVEILEDTATAQNFELELAPAHSVSGTVTDADGNPLPGARVTIPATPIEPVLTDGDGFYSFAGVPEGEYTLLVDAAGCYAKGEAPLIVDADEDVDFALDQVIDAYGYSCRLSDFSYVEATNELPLFGDDSAVSVELPFGFVHYGQIYNSVEVGTNGYVQFLEPFAFSFFFNEAIPSVFLPNGAVYAFWDDLFVDDLARVRTEVIGSAPNRGFVIEWSNVPFLANFDLRVSFEMVLFENGEILMQYASADGDPLQSGASATVGIENESGTIALQYSHEMTALHSGLSVRYSFPPSGFVQGYVTDANSGEPLSGATVEAAQGGSTVRSAQTRDDGFYRLHVPVGDYQVQASFPDYSTETAFVSIAEGQFVDQSFVLRTPRASVSPAMFQLVVPANETRERSLFLENNGSLDLEFSVHEAGGARQQAVATARLARNPFADPNATDTRDLFGAGVRAAGWTAQLPGDVLKTFTPVGLGLAWGTGYTGDLWLSDVFNVDNNEFTVDGAPTGREWAATWAGDWPGDMAYDAGRNLVCQVNVGGDNGIYCWDPNTGNVVDSITGPFPWTGISQRGLAYRPDDDTFYIGGWNEGIIYHVQGLSHPDRGQVIESCFPPDGNISGLGWNGSVDVLWVATNSFDDTIYELDPGDCSVLATLAHPNPGFNGAGLEVDDLGNLWIITQFPNQVHLMESGVPAFSDVPWLSVAPTAGTVPIGFVQELGVTINTAGLQPGAYLASIFIRTNAAGEPLLRVPVSLIVPAYQQGVDSGATKAYIDGLGDTWAADRKHTVGSWGYVEKKSKTASTKQDISDTDDPKLFQTQRIDPYAYRFDNVPNGTYEINFKFAELEKVKFGGRLFDVIVEDTVVLPAHDIFYEVGRYAAEDRTFFLQITDNRMDVRLVPRAGASKPVINALRVTHRPDR